MASRKQVPVTQNNEIYVSGVFKSINIKIESGEGTFFFAFDEDEKGNLVRILGFGAKAGTAQAAWINSLCGLISAQLEKKAITLEEIKMHLSSMRSDRMKSDKNGVVCSSGPEALFIACIRYSNMKVKELTHNLPIMRKGSVD